MYTQLTAEKRIKQEVLKLLKKELIRPRIRKFQLIGFRSNEDFGIYEKATFEVVCDYVILGEKIHEVMSGEYNGKLLALVEIE